MAKTKVQYEFPMHCQSEILYEYMASAEGLSEWFADDVIEKGDDFFFSWNGGPGEKRRLFVTNQKVLSATVGKRMKEARIILK